MAVGQNTGSSSSGEHRLRLVLQLRETLALQERMRASIMDDDFDLLADLVAEHGARLESVTQLLPLVLQAEELYPEELIGQVRDGLSHLELIAASRLKLMGNELKKCGELRSALRGYADGSTQTGIRRVSMQG